MSLSATVLIKSRGSESRRLSQPAANLRTLASKPSDPISLRWLCTLKQPHVLMQLKP
ncbi:hypothetical protein K443DRAFT_674977 [Laccaria amethystina LaAM-08-1]|uniref:Unplaced genomic scaffold K443scaffold_23, whole genome shotgun sequence n=1 Tax=Laccaria amethystina LaAM-08-1 TaxID=1095629 RepID=A0A0C9X0T0_9AGAR|nr:hypothetical protein K443DRAFT_674977 [Laccaria amethystina LaAM-08-1]